MREDKTYHCGLHKNSFYLRKNTTPLDKAAVNVILPSDKYDNHFLYLHPNRKKKIIKHLPKTSKPPKTVHNFIGVELGRMQIIGYSHKRYKRRIKKNLHYWVAVCVCGNYEYRNNKTLNKRLKIGLAADMCEECKRREDLKRRHARKQGISYDLLDKLDKDKVTPKNREVAST